MYQANDSRCTFSGILRKQTDYLFLKGSYVLVAITTVVMDMQLLKERMVKMYY